MLRVYDKEGEDLLVIDFEEKVIKTKDYSVNLKDKTIIGRYLRTGNF